MKILKKISSRDIYIPFFAVSISQFLVLPFVDAKEVWRHFFTGAITLFIGLVILGLVNPRK